MCAEQVGAIHPQSVVDELDDFAADLEDENDNLNDKKKELEDDTQRLEEKVRSLEEREAATQQQLAEAHAQCNDLRAQGEQLRDEMAEMRQRQMEEKAGAELPPEQQAAVAAALNDVFTASPPSAEPPPEPGFEAESEAQKEAKAAGRRAALESASKGASPDEVAAAATEAQELVESAHAVSRDAVRRAQETGEPPEVLDAIGATLRRAILAGHSAPATAAACDAAKSAAQAGARPAEVEVAANAACETCDDLGPRKAASAGKAALHLVRHACAADVAIVAAEAAARTLDRPSEEVLHLYAERAAESATNGKMCHYIVTELSENPPRAYEQSLSKPAPTMDEIVRRNAVGSAAGSEARKRFSSPDCGDAAESAVERIMVAGGSEAQAAVGARAVSFAISLGLGQDAADAACICALAAFDEVESMAPSDDSMQPAVELAPPGTRMLHRNAASLPLLSMDEITDSVNRTFIADAAGEASAKAYGRGVLKFDALRAGAAVAAWALRHSENEAQPELHEAVARSAEKACRSSNRLDVCAISSNVAGQTCAGGAAPLVVDAAAAAAVKSVMEGTQQSDEEELCTSASHAAVEAARQAEAVLDAATAAAQAAGKQSHDALEAAQAAIESGGGVAAATAFAISGNSVEESTAALMACHGAQMQGGLEDGFDLAQIDLLVAAAIVATDQANAGATAQMATRAGASAAASVAAGATLDEVQAAARAAIPEIPGWSLESWLSSLSFDKIVSEAILKRVRDAVPEGHSVRAYEQSFVAKLGERGDVELIMALLKETPVLRMIAEKICSEAQTLVAELEEARREKEMAEAEEKRRQDEIQRVREERARAEGSGYSAKRRWTRLQLQKNKLAGKQPNLASAALDARKSAEEMNADAVKKGAFTLSFSTDASLYWNGLSRITGSPGSQMEKPIMTWMEEEHCSSVDSNEVFEVGNYGTATTSRAEWLFVVHPDQGLDILQLDEWPGAEEARNRHDLPRTAHPLSYFRSEWEAVDRRLVAAGEQPLSEPEFIALRLYTGPLFRKYNAVLRSKCGVKFLEKVFHDVCLSNTYATTIHVLTAAIIKLGKIVPADLVYRAPGGALPKSFWHKQPEGCQGGLELAFMSTTTAKQEAMAYARRAPGMILFELQQGFVARGASISWLSQYPNEEEILFPPLTALEVSGTRVEGAVLIVELRPSMKAPDTVKTGTKDIEDMNRVRAEAEAMAKEAQLQVDDEKRKSKHALALQHRQAAWKQSMLDVQLSASRRQAETAKSKLLIEKKASLASTLHSTADRTLKRDLTTKLELASKELQESLEAVAQAQKKAEAAQSSEQRALKAKQEAETKLGKKSRDLIAQYGQNQFMKGVMRAKNLAAMKAQVATDVEAPAPAEAPVEEEPIKIDYGPLGEIAADEAVVRFKEVVGQPADWALRAVAQEDVDFAHLCCDKLLTLCATNKKQRKAAAQAGAFDELGKALKRFEGNDELTLKLLEVVATCAKKAETDKIQGEASACIVALIEGMDGLLFNAYDAIQNMTRNNRDNTIKLIRLGGRVEWLDPESNVVPPDQPPTAPKKLSRERTDSPLKRESTQSLSPGRKASQV